MAGQRRSHIDPLLPVAFTAMVAGLREAAIETGLTQPEAFDAGIRALYRTAAADGVFCYTFFKALATNR